jgi:thiamine-phosphate pyrophosphorylase
MAAKVSGLYAVTPDLATDTDGLLRKVEAAIRGGARIVQYRSKAGSQAVWLEQLQRLVPICRRGGASLIVNDKAGLAAEAGAQGVHLGMDDGPFSEARRLLGPARWIGVSCYNDLQRARDAAAAGADYVAFGSFFPSATKPGAVRASLALLSQARKEIALPIVAIGGINAGNAAALIEAGADAVAVVSALFDSADIEAEARRLSGLFAGTTDYGIRK